MSPIAVSDSQKTSATLLSSAVRQQRPAIFFHAACVRHSFNEGVCILKKVAFLCYFSMPVPILFSGATQRK